MGIARTLALLLLLVSLALGAAACSDDDGGGGDSGSGDGSSTATTDDGRAAGGGGDEKVAAAEADLEFTIEQVGDKGGAGIPLPQRAVCSKSIPASCTGELACPAADDAREGDLELCAWLAERGRAALQPVDDAERQVCTQIYGGAEVASVTGTLDGKPVSENFTRENGCAIARWDAVAPLWTGEVPPASDGAPDAGASRGAIGNPGAATSSPPATGAPQPEIMTDPPEAFDR